MKEQNENLAPSPTVPNKEIFNSNPQLNKEVDSTVKTEMTLPVPTTPPSEGVSKKFNKNIILIFGGVLVFFILIVGGVKVYMTKVSGPQRTKIVWLSLDEDVDAVTPLINEYKQNNPNVTIEFVKQSPQDYRERLTNALAKGQGPDIFEYHNSWVPMFVNDLSVTKEDFSSTFYPVVTSDLKTRNGFVGIPLEYDGIALFYNQDIFQAYGKSAPKTWDDLRKIALDLTIKDPNGSIKQSGVALGRTENVDYWQDIFALLMLQNGADLAKPADL